MVGYGYRLEDDVDTLFDNIDVWDVQMNAENTKAVIVNREVICKKDFVDAMTYYSLLCGDCVMENTRTCVGCFHFPELLIYNTFA